MDEPHNEIPPEEQRQAEPTAGVDARDLDMLNVGRSFGLENIKDVKKNELRLNHLMNWAKAKGAKDDLGMIAELRGLQHKLGSRSIHDLYVYTRLDIERMETEGKMSKMEAHG
jgi:hypothetical protein